MDHISIASLFSNSDMLGTYNLSNAILATVNLLLATALCYMVCLWSGLILYAVECDNISVERSKAQNWQIIYIR